MNPPGGGVVGESVGVNVIGSSDDGGDNENDGGGGNANSSWRGEYKGDVESENITIIL